MWSILWVDPSWGEKSISLLGSWGENSVDRFQITDCGISHSALWFFLNRCLALPYLYCFMAWQLWKFEKENDLNASRLLKAPLFTSNSARSVYTGFHDVINMCTNTCLKWKQTEMDKRTEGNNIQSFKLFLNGFIENLKEKCDDEDPIPLRFHNPRVTTDELEGECLDWVLNYLSTRYI